MKSYVFQRLSLAYYASPRPHRLQLRNYSLLPIMPFETLARCYRAVRDKDKYYLLAVALLIPTGMYVSHWLNNRNFSTKLRYSIYQRLQNLSPNQSFHARNVALVLIGDEEYWHGELARRVPIKRDYLARLLTKLDATNPSVIALDFDFQLHNSRSGCSDYIDYSNETAELGTTIQRVSINRDIVLPKTLRKDENGDYILDSSFLDCIPQSRHIHRGYISLPYDTRRIPLTIELDNRAKALSFAASIVESIDQSSIDTEATIQRVGMPYGAYIKPHCFDTYSSSEILTTGLADLTNKLAHKIVIIGGAWHSHSFNRGPTIDSYITPVGTIGGPYIHANYVEALLGKHTYEPWNNEYVLACDLIASFCLSIGLIYHHRLIKKITFASLLCLSIAFVSYFSWMNLGFFFDPFLPIIILVGHLVIDQVFEWKIDAKKYRQITTKASS